MLKVTIVLTNNFEVVNLFSVIGFIEIYFLYIFDWVTQNHVAQSIVQQKSDRKKIIQSQ